MTASLPPPAIADPPLPTVNRRRPHRDPAGLPSGSQSEPSKPASRARQRLAACRYRLNPWLLSHSIFSNGKVYRLLQLR
ncbi:MAG: hypothetical protein ACFB0G_17945 [Leptolyngbyaceae cyanobacterium]